MSFLMLVGGLCLVAATVGGPEATGFKFLLAGGFALLVVGCVAQPKRPLGNGGDCYTDWDGRSNSIICD